MIGAADSSKLSRHAFAQICPIAEITRVVTDTGASDEQVAVLEAAGTQVSRV